MSVRSAIQTALTSVSTNASSRVYRGIAPQGASYPYITWTTITDPPDAQLLATRRKANRAVVQVDIWGVSSTDTTSIGKALDIGLDEYDSTEDSIEMQWFLDDDFDGVEFQHNGSQTKLYRITQNWIVWHSPPTT